MLVYALVILGSSLALGFGLAILGWYLYTELDND